MKILVVFVAAIALVSAEEPDELEVMANNILKNIHPHMGGEGSENSLYASLTNSEFAKGAVDQLNKTRRDRIEESIGSGGLTFVSVTKGKRQVNVTTVYGFGGGAIINIRDRQRQGSDGEPDEVSMQEVNEITQPLYDNYVKDIVEPEAGETVVVHLGGEGRKEFGLRDKYDEVKAKSCGGWRVGARTHVSKRG